MLFTRIQEDTYYNGNRDQFYHDTVAAYQKAIQAFYDAGCRYLQLDDTSWIDFVSEERINAVVEKLGMDVKDIINTRVSCLNDAISKSLKICSLLCIFAVETLDLLISQVGL